MNNNLHDIILFDEPERRTDLLPLAFTRPVADFRLGITTLREKWEALLPGRYFYLTAPHLEARVQTPPRSEALYIDSSLVASADLAEAVAELAPGEALTAGDELLAFRGTADDFEAHNYTERTFSGEYKAIRQLYDIFQLNADAIRDDFRRITAGVESAPLPASCTMIGPERDEDGNPLLFISPDAKVEGAMLNTSAGPIYIGPGAEVTECTALRGPLAVCRGSRINMGAKIYPGTTIGPVCRVGGEINNAVIFGYSNKAHDGFLGNAVIGEWCNIGAGTNASNLKNDYSPIRLWNYRRHTFARTGLQFCGLIMGDHSKAGINCMFNTATVVGVGVNIYGAGFPRTFIPSFSIGSPAAGFLDLPLSKFYDTASRVMARRGVELTDADRTMFEHIYEQAKQFK